MTSWMTCRLALLVTLVLVVPAARADSVAQIATGVRISRGTATLIDPQGRPGVVGTGTHTAVLPGDVLTFIAEFTPVPNGDVRGLGGYVTVYVPRNTEVVGVRISDATDATVAPNRGGFGPDGVGPRGLRTYAAPLVEGSLSQLYADTGVFYSTDSRTARVPDGSVAAEVFLTLFNGILLSPTPTAAGQLAPILGSDPAFPYAHNLWDAIQTYAFGVPGGAINTVGTGNTPDRYGSPVAGPDTWYTNEASYAGDLAAPLVVADVVATGTTGPWRRIQTMGGEIGRRGATPPVPSPGTATRVGVIALDGTGRLLGVTLDTDHPLPAYDPANPSDPYTRALRFAVGELVVGREYFSEFSLRVLDTPLDPVSGTDAVCAEVFGGDSSAQQADGTRDGKDNAWRYFLPAPACVALDLLFELDVDKLVALIGERLSYTITGKNLRTSAHHNVVVRYCYETGEVTFVSATPPGVSGTGAGCPDPATQDDVSWTIPLLDPGDEFNYGLEFDAVVAGRSGSTVGRAIFTSNELPDPGFQTVAFTVIAALTVIDLDLTAAPDVIASPPGTVHYTATVRNLGTGIAAATGCRTDPCRIVVTLPSGFAYVPGTARIDGGPVADPAVAAPALTFTAGLVDLAPGGGTMSLEFDAAVPAGTPAGTYTSAIETWLADQGFGVTVDDARAGLAEVVVGALRSDTPLVGGPLVAGMTTVAGTTTEAAGTTIRVFLNGIESSTTVSGAGGSWSATVPALYPGQGVSASAQAPGEFESLRSAEIIVLALAGSPACSDGADNDGDGLTDFPADPDCTSASDPDEAHTPECADGADNDADGLTDFGADPGCSSLLDDSEAGGAECSDGADNDGDGLTDFPADPGCGAADDVSETDLPQCSDGVDNDGDGSTDFPLDDGCDSALDDDETSAIGPTDGGDGAADADADGGVDDAAEAADGSADRVAPPDPGGVDAPGGGCGCATAGTPAGSLPLLVLLLLAFAVRTGRPFRRRP